MALSAPPTPLRCGEPGPRDHKGRPFSGTETAVPLARAPTAAISGPEINTISGVSGMSAEAETVAQTHPFQAEVAQLLRLMVHSVYSETEIFLRELISNGSDACDKLRYEAIGKPELMKEGIPLAIRIKPDTAAG